MLLQIDKVSFSVVFAEEPDLSVSFLLHGEPKLPLRLLRLLRETGRVETAQPCDGWW